MDDECLDALSYVVRQYGDTITHGAGLEVRLGEEARYVDYIMNIDEDLIPGIKSLWYEIDYEEFQRAGIQNDRIVPCLFANTDFEKEGRAAWDKFLPPFLGEERAEKLRPAFDQVLERLPEGAHIKQIGTMTGRGELAIMRLVILFPSWETIPGGLAAIGWQGDTAALKEALEPWKETQGIAVNIDLGEDGVLPKIGVEVFSRWRHQILVDKFITRLEEAGLCLPSKGNALRRWIRISPDGDPFIQTLIAYFKLNYKDGKITEAKAYLEQSPYIHHHYFDCFEHPVRLDMELSNGDSVLSIDDALAKVRECRDSRVRRVRLYGSESYEHLDRLLEALDEEGLTAEIVLGTDVEQERLLEMHEAGNATFLVDIRSADELDTLALLHELKITPVRARWYMCEANEGELEALADRVEALGVAELILNGMSACGEGQTAPGPDGIKKAADLIGRYKSDSMVITVDSCFSPLRAYIGGKDPKRNANRGISRGCEAGRSFMALRSDGKYTPCLSLVTAGEASSLEKYWERSGVLSSLRGKKNTACEGCTYDRRCLPCPALVDKKQGSSPSCFPTAR